jgi:hypothetical protein
MGEAPLALSLNAAGSVQDFRSVDNIAVLILGPGEEVVLDTSLPFSGDDEEANLRVRVDTRFASQQLFIEVVLLDGTFALYQGSTSFTLDAADRTVVQVTVQPIISAVTLANPVATMAALGAQVQLTGAATLANGDTVPDVPLTWTSLDARIVTVTTGGLASAVAEGQARVRAATGTTSAEGIVQVRQAVDTVIVTPPSAIVAIGGTVSLSAQPRDARGNTIAGRTVAWTSSDSTIARVHPTGGTVTGVRSGSATITAALEGSQTRVPVTVQSVSLPAAPSNLTATGSQTTISMTWTDNATTETEYQVYRRTGTSPSAPTVLRATLPAGTTAYADNTATLDEQFEYTIRACNAAGCSNPSNAFTIQTVPRPPANLALTQAGRILAFVWQDASTYETSFRLEQRVGTGSFSVVATTGPNTTQLQHTGVPGLNTFRMVACNGSGCSTPSNEVSATITTPPPLVTTLSAFYDTEMVGHVDGQGAPYTTWFEWSLSPSLASPNLTPQVNGTQPQDWVEPLQGLQPDVPIYYRIVAANAGGTAKGEVLSFLALAPFIQAFPDTAVCNSDPAGSGVCPVTPDSTLIQIGMDGPLGFAEPFARVYLDAISSTGLRIPAGTASVTMIDNRANLLRTWLYDLDFRPDYRVLPAGIYTLELYGETPSGGSVRVINTFINVKID